MNYKRTHGSLSLTNLLKLETRSVEQSNIVFFCVAMDQLTGAYMLVQVLSISGAEFSWSKDAQVSTLQDINLVVRKGDLVGVLGRVGAGKVQSINWLFCA